jgi:pyruvate dehydrogenase E2 component (dihydrolipoamide acetyltransferase)
MKIDIKMPALSPTMEEGTLAKWLVKEGDTVSAGDILAEIETDKATMEFEAVDEGRIGKIAVPAGSAGVKVGTVIATIEAEGDDAPAAAPAASPPKPVAEAAPAPAAPPAAEKPAPAPVAKAPPARSGDRIAASPLARRLAAERQIDLSAISGSGPHGRIVRSDLDGVAGGTAKPPAAAPSVAPAPVAAATPAKPATASPGVQVDERIPHTIEKLSGMRKTIARRLTQSKQEAPHIYLSVDVRLDSLLGLRSEINEALAAEGVKVSVNDLLVKALGKALMRVPECNVSFGGTELVRYQRADISVAVSIPGGLITPIVQDAGGKPVSQIAREMKDLGARAKEGKLKPEEYQGGTASISNMGMMGIREFSAVINPPQAMILAVGAGEKRQLRPPRHRRGRRRAADGGVPRDRRAAARPADLTQPACRRRFSNPPFASRPCRPMPMPMATSSAVGWSG